MEKLKRLFSGIIFVLILVSAANAALLDQNEVGFGGQTRSNNYDELVNAMYSNGKVTTTIGGDKLWVAWFKTSSSCAQSDLQSGNNCNSGSAIDFTHNCMVTDEFSQVGVLAAMGKDQKRMDDFYNTVLATKSTNGDIPAWRIYRNGDTIEPCKQGINGNCDTASDATARIIIALYAGAKNPYFTDSAKKSQYLAHANKLSADFVEHELEKTCRPSSLGYGDVCYWMAGGSNVKRAGIGAWDFAYTGYFADGVIAMLQAYANTGNAEYKRIAEHLSLNYLQAANWDGSKFTAPPGKSFRWVPDSNGIPRAQCTNTCAPVMWDQMDASRAIGMCQANYYAKQMGINLPGLQDYCTQWGNKYMGNTNNAPLQYYPNGDSVSYQSGYFAQGLQALFQAGGHNPALFKATVDNALNHYNTGTRTFDSTPCFGVYTQAFAVRALGMGIGRDAASFGLSGSGSTGTTTTTTGTTNTTTGSTGSTGSTGTTTGGTATTTPILTGIASLQRACSYGSTQCSVKSDVTSGTCRTMILGTANGDIKVMGCEKSGGYVELYKQAAPNGLVFSACLANGCVNKDSGFAKFIPTTTTTTSGTTTSTTGTTNTTTGSTGSTTTTTPSGTTNTTSSTGSTGSTGGSTTGTTSTTTTILTGIASLQRACSYGSTQCSVKSDVTSGTCRTMILGTANGDIKVMGCEKSGGYVELYKQAAPNGLVFSACLANGCVNKDSGFVRFIPTSTTSGTTSSTTGTATGSTSTTSSTGTATGSTTTSTDTSSTSGGTGTATSGTTSTTTQTGVMGLSLAVTPSGTKNYDSLESSGCRKASYTTPYGQIDGRVCPKGGSKYEMYLLTPANKNKLCVGTACVGSNSGFASFTA